MSGRIPFLTSCLGLVLLAQAQAAAADALAGPPWPVPPVSWHERQRTVEQFLVAPGGGSALEWSPWVAGATPAPEAPVQPAGESQVGGASSPEDHEVHARRFNARAGSRSMLRIKSSEGLFVGKVARVDAAGFHGLAPSDSRSAQPTPFPDPLPWGSVYSVEKRVGSSGTFAIVGGLTVGLLGALAGAAVASALGGSESETSGGAAFGFVAAGAAGAGLGALIGAAVPRWSRVDYLGR